MPGPVERELYDALEVRPDASQEDIKAGFRKAALANHPDRAAGDPQAAARWKVPKEAYEILSDPGKRALYDREGKAAVEREEQRRFAREKKAAQKRVKQARREEQLRK